MAAVACCWLSVAAVAALGPTFSLEYPTGDLLKVQLYGELGEVARVTVTPHGARSFVRHICLLRRPRFSYPAGRCR